MVDGARGIGAVSSDAVFGAGIALGIAAATVATGGLALGFGFAAGFLVTWGVSDFGRNANVRPA